MYGGTRSHRTFFNTKISVATAATQARAWLQENKRRMQDFRFRRAAEPGKTARQIRIDQIRAEHAE
jgi:hypothetical protein